MRLLRRLIGAFTLLLSAVGIVACTAGIAGTWMLHQRVAETVRAVSAKLDGGLGRVSDANQKVRGAVEKARADVTEAGKESAGLGGGGDKSRRTARALRGLIQQQAGPNMDELGGRLATLSDAAVAASSLLESFQELPAARRLRADPDEFKRRADEVQQLAGTLRRLEAVIGDGSPGADAREVAAATGQVDGVLQKCQAALDGWQSNLDATRDDLARATAEAIRWAACAAVVATLLCLWVGRGRSACSDAPCNGARALEARTRPARPVRTLGSCTPQ
jgi:hypothetical protein